MKCGKWLLLFLGIGVAVHTTAQNVVDIEKLFERNGIEEVGGAYEEMVNTLLQFSMTPLNLNTATFDSLKMLYFLSDSQIDELIAFRKKYGYFMHLSELLWVPGIGKQDIDNISCFVTLGDLSVRNRLEIVQKRLKHEALMKIRTTYPRQEGYQLYAPSDFSQKEAYDRKVMNRFRGPNFGTLLKYKLKCGRQWQAGMVLENDPGEAYFTRYQKYGFDFVSAYFSLNLPYVINGLIIGDYRIQWGQGLIAWGGFSSGKSDLAVGNEKSGKGFAVSNSTDENNYLRGIALSLKWGKSMVADLFYSMKKTDGNVVATDTLPEEELLSVSLSETGYHRSYSECLKKHSLKERTTGFSVRWNTDAFRIGAQVLYYNFSPSLTPGKQIYQQYADSGSKRWMMSVDYKTSWKGIYFFGEVARSDVGAWAMLHGARKRIAHLSACILYRRYDKDYVSHYAAGFGEYSNTSNEEGLYCGIDITPLKNLKINLYYDAFRFYSPRYGATIPGSGCEGLLQVSYQHEKWEHTLRYKYENRPEDLKGKVSVDRIKGEFRYQLNGNLNKNWEWRMRLSMSHYRKTQLREAGYMAYQDVIYTAPKNKLKIQCRLAWFKTDSYQSRIYVYENNVLYGYSFPSFMGEGYRSYLNLSWKPFPKWTCYLKGGYVIYPDRETISSGVTKVEGNQLYDLTFQIRFAI